MQFQSRACSALVKGDGNRGEDKRWQGVLRGAMVPLGLRIVGVAAVQAGDVIRRFPLACDGWEMHRPISAAADIGAKGPC